MDNDHEFYNLNDLTQGIRRVLAPGLNARVFVGDHAMLSLVSFEPNAAGQIHSHPEEQWGVLLAGDGVRVQGTREFPVSAGDFWRTPGGVPHSFRAGDEGARKRAVEMIHNSSVIDDSYDMAQAFCSTPRKALEGLPNNLYRRSLTELLSYVLERKN